MKKIRLLLMLVMGYFFSTQAFGQSAKKITDYLNVPGPVVFDAKSFNLAWSSHPSANYYKQEYVPNGETVEKFKSVLLLEVLTGDAKVKDIVAAKIDELKTMKASNPIVQYEMFQKDGEYIIDFLLSANSADGKSIAVIERNVYRYKSLTAKPGVLLFAASTRAYGKDADKFLVDLKTNKSKLVNAVAGFKVPVVGVK